MDKQLILALLLCAVASGQPLAAVVTAHVSGGGGTVATPTDSPGAGTYGSTQSVTLSDGTAGAAICYTTDGSTPGAATPGTCDSSPTQTYSSAISVSVTTTIKALGTKAALTNSSVLSSTYTISATVTRDFMAPGVGYINFTGSLRQYSASYLGLSESGYVNAK